MLNQTLFRIQVEKTAGILITEPSKLYMKFAAATGIMWLLLHMEG